MEFVEGKTLAQLIPAGGMALAPLYLGADWDAVLADPRVQAIMREMGLPV